MPVCAWPGCYRQFWCKNAKEKYCPACRRNVPKGDDFGV